MLKIGFKKYTLFYPLIYSLCPQFYMEKNALTKIIFIDKCSEIKRSVM